MGIIMDETSIPSLSGLILSKHTSGPGMGPFIVFSRACD